MTKIAYVVPGPMSKTRMGKTEMKRRERMLNNWAFPGTEVSVIDVPQGPASIESAYEEALCVPATVELAAECEAEGFDAIIIGCFGDPGIEAAREMLSIPVVGPCEASMLAAAPLGHKFSILTVFDSLIAGQEHLAVRAGLQAKLASVRAVNIPVLELMEAPETTRERMIEVTRACATEDRADAVLFGCMTMSFLDFGSAVTEATGLPVVNAGLAALKLAESQIAMGLSHSKTAWPTPAKIVAGQRPGDLRVG